MSVLVDTGVLVGQENHRDQYHVDAKRSFGALLAGRFGRPFTSDYVFDEAVTLAKARTRSHARAMALADRILGRGEAPEVFDVLMVTGPMFREAVRVFEKHADRDLSFTDATTIALIERRRIDHVLSFDRGFDGIVSRIDPRDVE